MPDSPVAPGWYPDPQDPSSSRQRWWDGTTWTDQYSPATEDAVSSPVEAPPTAPPPQKSSSRTPVILAVVGVVALLIVIGGVAAFAVFSSSSEPSSVSATPDDPEGEVVTADGASLVLPGGWESVPTDEADLKAYLDEAAAANPDIAEGLETTLSALAGQGFAMVAVSSDLSTDAFATNANLIVTPNDGTSLEDAASSVTAQLAQVGATDVESTEVDVNGVPGLKSTYTLAINTAAGPTDVYGIQYLVIGDENAAFLTISSTSDNAAGDAEAMAQTLVVD